MISQFSEDGARGVMKPKERAAYSAPKLSEYGRLSDITLAVVRAGKGDNGNSDHNHTLV